MLIYSVYYTLIDYLPSVLLDASLFWRSSVVLMLIARPDMGGFVSLTPTIWMATCPTFEFTHSHFQRPHPVIWFFWMGNKSLVLAIGLQRISDSDLNERISVISSLVCSGTLPQIRPNPLHLTFSLLIKSRRKTFLFILRSAYR